MARLCDGRELIYFDTGPAAARNSPDRRPLPTARPQSQLRRDPLTRAWVIYAGHRQDRMHLPDAADCPLCPTTPDRPTEIPAPDYEVVVFENRYPALTAAAPGTPAPGVRDGPTSCSRPARRRAGARSSASPAIMMPRSPAFRPSERAWSSMRWRTGRGSPRQAPGGRAGVLLREPRPGRRAQPARAGLRRSSRRGRPACRRRAMPPSPAGTCSTTCWRPSAPPRWRPGGTGRRSSLTRPGRELFALHWELFTTRRSSDKLKYLAGSESGMDAFASDVLPERAAEQLRKLA